jgi:hypothetical protein
VDLEHLRKPDAGHLMKVGFYVDDSIRDVENVGLRPDEAEALRLVAAYERSNGRDPTSAQGGYVRAASRMLDNAFDSDDGPHENAKFMAADLALQRHAGSVVDAAEAYGKNGTEPVGFDKFLVEYVITADLQNDDDIKADWKAMAEGRFEDASSMVHEIIEHAVRHSEHLPEGAGTWMYENERREEEPELDRRSNLVDVLEMVDEQPSYEPTSGDFQEWLAGEPDHYDWDDARYKAESDRFYGREAEPEPRYMTREEITQERMREAREISLMPQNVVDEIERLGRDGVSFDDKAIYVGGDRLRIMLDMGEDPRSKDLAAALAHAVMSERGTSASESSAWMFEEKPALGVSDMLARIDREDGDRRHGISPGTSERIVMSQAKDSVRGLTQDDRSVDGMVTACQLVAEEKNVPVKRLMAMVAEERRRFDHTFAARSDVVNDAVKEVLLEASIALAIENRSGPRKDPREERPFFSDPTIERMDQASRDVGDLMDSVRMSDETIAVVPGLRTAYATLDAAGLNMWEGSDRLESAWGRVLEARDERGPLSPAQEARMAIYDVATQTEALGVTSGIEGRVDEGAIGRSLVTAMGIRTIRQEQAGPMPLTPSELGMVAAGNFSDLPRGSQAGFSLGLSWAKDSEGLPLREPVVEKARGGLFGQAAGAASTGFSRVEAKAPDQTPPSAVVTRARAQER